MVYYIGNQIFAGLVPTAEPTHEEAVAMIDKVIKIQNAASDTPTIDIDGFIGDLFFEESTNTVKAIRAKMKEISKLKAKKIIVNINSPGGFVDAGLGIHDILATHKAEVETNIGGLTASIATIIAQSGDTRRMSDNALFLIHEPMNGGIRNISEAEQNLDQLKKVHTRMVNIYDKRNSISSEDQIRELMNAGNGGGKWIDADEALELGYIDEIYEPMQAAAAVLDKNIQSVMHLPDLPNVQKSIRFEDSQTEDKNNQFLDIMKKEFQAILATLTGLLKTKKEGSEEETISDEAQAVINDLQAKIDEVGNQEDQISALTTNVTTLGEQVASLRTERDTFKASLKTANEEIDTLKTDLVKAKGASTKAPGLQGGEDPSAPPDKETAELNADLISLNARYKNTA